MDVLFHEPRPSFIPLRLSKQLPSVSFITETHINIITSILTFVLPIITLYYVYQDYRGFLSLGPGGTPQTPAGYAKLKLLSVVSLRDPLRPISIPAHFRPQQGYLSLLPEREGKRPVIHGIAPQRQRTQRSSSGIYNKLVDELKKLAKQPENKLLERTSCFEKHSSGLFASTPITRVCGGEICHAHPSDGSLHLTLHPSDARIVIENGWGERHPLAKGGWFRRFVPKEFMLIYAPRNEEEVSVVMQIVAASVWWVSGIDVASGELDRRVSGAGLKEEERAERRAEKRMHFDDEVLGKAREENECWSCNMHGCGRRTKGNMIGEA